MKNTTKIIVLAFIVAITACSTNYNDGFERDTDSGWLEFGSVSTMAVDTLSQVTIPIFQQSATNSSRTTITYSVVEKGGNAPENILGTFEVSIPKATTPDAELIAEVNFDVSGITQPFILEITILDTNKNNLIIGLEGDQESDHPIVHTLSVGVAYSGESYIGGSLVSEYITILSAIPGETNLFAISSAWGANFVADAVGDPSLEGQFPYDGTLLLNADNTVVITGTEPYATGGQGTYDSSANTYTYSLTQALFANPFLVDVVLTGL